VSGMTRPARDGLSRTEAQQRQPRLGAATRQGVACRGAAKKLAKHGSAGPPFVSIATARVSGQKVGQVS
jgi:hypothetical protein